MAYKCVSPNRVFSTTGVSTSTNATYLGLPNCVVNVPMFFINIEQSLVGKTESAPVYASYGSYTVPIVDILGNQVESSSINTGSLILVGRVCSVPSKLVMVNFVQATGAAVSVYEGESALNPQ